MGGQIDLSDVYLAAKIADLSQDLFNILWENRNLRELIVLELLCTHAGLRSSPPLLSSCRSGICKLGKGFPVIVVPTIHRRDNYREQERILIIIRSTSPAVAFSRG